MKEGIELRVGVIHVGMGREQEVTHGVGEKEVGREQGVFRGVGEGEVGRGTEMIQGTERGATDTTPTATGGAIHGITIITSTVCFTFPLQMSFLVRAAARSGSLGIQMARAAPACQWRLFSTDAEEKIVTPFSRFDSQNKQKMQDMMIEKLKKQADATVVKIKDISYDAGYL